MPHKANRNSAKRLLLSVVCLVVTFALAELFSMAFGFFSDRANDLSQQGAAGTVIVQLIEEDPFGFDIDDPSYDSEESQFIDHKTFHGKSEGSLDTYIRAYLKPVVEAYDEDMEAWILVPVSGSNVKLEVTDVSGKWIGANVDGVRVSSLSDAKYYYFAKIMKTNDVTTDLHVQIVDIDMPDRFLNMEIRYNLHVFIEGAQTKNSLWMKIFDINDLPVGVER